MSNSQFKLLRENTLVSFKSKETHARFLQQNLGKSEIKNIKTGQFRRKSNLNMLTPIDSKSSGLHQLDSIIYGGQMGTIFSSIVDGGKESKSSGGRLRNKIFFRKSRYQVDRTPQVVGGRLVR